MAARDGMDTLIQQVRDYAACGTADYSVGSTAYWTDDQLQAQLDMNRSSVRDEQLTRIATVASDGTTEYYEYRSTNDHYEETTGGTAVFYLRLADGSRVGENDYTPDYTNGRITFDADTGGSVVYLTGESYDVHGAAANVWDLKAAHVAHRYDFEADGAAFQVSQMVAQYKDQARQLRSMSPGSGTKSHTMKRSDIVA